MKILDTIILSSIYTAKKNGIFSDIWKLNSISYFSFATSSYILTLGLIIEHWFYEDIFSFFFFGDLIPHNEVGFGIQWIGFLLIPIFVITYRRYISDNKYKKIEKKHPCSSKLPFAIYVVLSMVSPIFVIYLKSKF